MIAFYRTAAINSGKVGSAIAFARQIAAYLKDRHGVEVSIAMPVAGNPSRIGWAARYENLASYEAKMAALTNDPHYMELAAQGAENFIPGTLHDELWRTL